MDKRQERCTKENKPVTEEETPLNSHVHEAPRGVNFTETEGRGVGAGAWGVGVGASV